MLLFIGGAARTGKGIVQRIVVRRLLAEMHLPYLSLDVLKMGLTSWHTGIRVDPDAGGMPVAEWLWPLVREMSMSLLNQRVDYVMEGEILPKHVDALRHTFPSQINACFLGYSAIAPAQKLHEIRNHAGYPNDWPQSYADADLLTIITRRMRSATICRLNAPGMISASSIRRAASSRHSMQLDL